MKSKFNYDQLHKGGYVDNGCYLNVDEGWEEIKTFVLKNVDKRASILELGSGGGYFGSWLVENGYEKVVVSDTSLVALEKIMRTFPRLKRVRLDAQKVEIERKVDVIIALDVIEHIPNVEKHLRSVRKSLKKGGVYIIKTPNKFWEVVYYKYILLRNDKERKHPWWRSHISLMSKKQLKERLNRNGFGVVEFVKQVVLTKAQVRKVREVFPRPFSTLILLVFNVFLRMVPYSLSVHFVAVAYNV